MSVKYIVNGVECEGAPPNTAMPGTTIWPQFTSVCSGATHIPSLPMTIPSGPIHPVEQTVPQGAYNDIVKLWFEAREENERLRKEIAELKARQE